MILIAKSKKVDDPKEFRPIVLLNTAGKVFFRVLGTHVLAVTRTSPICKRFAVTAHHFYKYLQPH